MEIQNIKTIYEATTLYKLIYIFKVNDDNHRDIIKIGDASIETNLPPEKLENNCSILNKAARDRIKQYSTTLGIVPQLLHTELAYYFKENENKKQNAECFRDYDVHKVLLNSGIEKVRPNDTTANEWFKTDLETAKNAIKAVKSGRKLLFGCEITDTADVEIVLREEQLDAIEKTIKVFKTGYQMLWNAKMRYGKTITALSLVKKELSKYKKTLIITHRPVVESGWRDDFNLVFKHGECIFAKKELESDSYEESSKIDYTNELQLKDLDNGEKPFIYFASIQDLRGSKRVGGKFDKNNAVFNIEWDLIINDEAHEGTQTELGIQVAHEIKKEKTKILSLSGTPFNIICNYDDEAIYTWDYIMEQSKKEEWDKTHPGDPNPYAGLPKMHIFTYDLGDFFREYIPTLEDKAFNFLEFFRTWTGNPQHDGKKIDPSLIGEFVHKSDVEKFLTLITEENENNSYPFSTPEYRDMFRHTLWMVPGVKEAKALSKMLHEHPIFRYFGIANVAGEGDNYEETHTKDALELVKKTICNNEYSITLSCGKLTTGVTIKEWTACLMLSGSYMTAAANYLQTIFRVQSPGNINGKAKENCYVFDFAPDRALRVVTEAARVSIKGGTGGTATDNERRAIMHNFLNFCPVIAIRGTTMKSYSVDNMMQQIKHIYAERAVNSGFDDTSIYNEALLTLDNIDIANFAELKKRIGSSKASKSNSEVTVNDQGLTDEQYSKIKEIRQKKEKKLLTEEEKALLDEFKKRREERNKAISILRGVSTRIPLLIFGVDVPITEDITIEKLVEVVDEESWKEFMPEGVTKELFNKFIKYYDKDVFVAASKKIRLKAMRADELLPTERVQQIARIHSKFKNPDKETVLTPWRVVNLHMANCLGGYSFYGDPLAEATELDVPIFVDRGEITQKTICNPNANILEINSKTGLYPLYATYCIYRAKCDSFEKTHPEGLSEKTQKAIWIKTVEENIFVICKTPMAKQITKRTLLGYQSSVVNMHSFDDLIMQLKDKPERFINKVSKKSFWGKGGNEEMKFDAVIGNPPYQLVVKEASHGNNANSIDIYPYFKEAALKLSNVVSLIYPAKDLQRGKETLMDNKLINVRIYNGSDKEGEKNIPGEPSVFGSAVRRIPGDVGIYLWDKGNPTEYIYYQDEKIKRTNKIMPVRKELFELAEKLEKYANSAKDYSIRKCCESNFVELHPESVLGIITSREQNPPNGYTKVVTNNVGGSGGKAYWYYIKTQDLDYLQPEVYKVIISSAYPNEAFKNPNSVEIAQKNEMFGRSKCCLYYSNNYSDVKNYLKYINSVFVKIVAQMTPLKFMYYLPDFETIKDEIDWEQSNSIIDQQIFSYFGVTEVFEKLQNNLFF